MRRPRSGHGSVGADATLAELTAAVRHGGRRPRRSATTCCAPSTQPRPTSAGVITESLAYSTLQAGPEFARWLAERGPAQIPNLPDPVQAERDGRHPARAVQPAAAAQRLLHRRPGGAARGARGRPAGSVGDRGGALAATVPSFCSGGDLAEFGTFADPASAHLARTRHSPALVLDEITARLGRACRAEVHGQVLGSGLEMAAFCGHVHVPARRDVRPARAGLGLIPGAGGTVSITRRIGRWRTAYLVLSGESIDAATALRLGPRRRHHAESSAGAAQRDPVRVLLGQEVADRQLDGRAATRRRTAGPPAASDARAGSRPRRPRRVGGRRP